MLPLRACGLRDGGLHWANPACRMTRPTNQEQRGAL
jgi:hypothetical protein